MITHDEQTLTLRVVDIDKEAEDVVSLRLSRADGGDLPTWLPGAHVDLHLANHIVRQYSLCSSPEDTTAWRIGILREPDSRGGSRYVHEHLKLTDAIEVVGPRNNFPLIQAEEYLFIAGGIGITPLLPMAEEAERSGASWGLVYGGRSRASMAFTTELDQYGERVTLLPQDETGLLDLQLLLKQASSAAHVYCCGPESLLLAVEEACADRSPGTVHFERFSPRASQGGAEPEGFLVKLERSGMTLNVAADESIVKALERAGVDVRTSCKEGICGSCETGVLAGIPEHHDSLLTKEERAAGDVMMVCVGRSLSPTLTLDL